MRKIHSSLLGNSLMVVGLSLCIASVIVAVASQVPNSIFTELWATGAVLGIFSGAFLWLFGAQLSGREKVGEKYYLLTLHKRRVQRHRHS